MRDPILQALIELVEAAWEAALARNDAAGDEA